MQPLEGKSSVIPTRLSSISLCSQFLRLQLFQWQLWYTTVPYAVWSSQIRHEKQKGKETLLWQSSTGRDFFKTEFLRLILWSRHSTITRKYKSAPFEGRVYYKLVILQQTEEDFGHSLFQLNQNLLLNRSLKPDKLLFTT